MKRLVVIDKQQRNHGLWGTSKCNASLSHCTLLVFSTWWIKFRWESWGRDNFQDNQTCLSTSMEAILLCQQSCSYTIYSVWSVAGKSGHLKQLNLLEFIHQNAIWSLSVILCSNIYIYLGSYYCVYYNTYKPLHSFLIESFEERQCVVNQSYRYHWDKWHLMKDITYGWQSFPFIYIFGFYYLLPHHTTY
jgi:hypothetical protein